MSAAIAFVLSVALMPLAVWLGRAAGMVDRPGPGGLKIHTTPVSVLGGPAAIVAALAGLAIADGISVGLLVGVGLAMSVGLVDDVKALPPWPRLALMGLAGVIAAFGILSGDAVVTITAGALLGVACTNAVNIVDGQDGLAGGLACIAALSMGFTAVILELPSVSALGFAASGGLIGFLLWNRPPARLFLGNGGAYGIGILLAAQAIALVASGVRGFLAAALCLGPFAFELILTAVRRMWRRTSVVAGDRLHSYDLLAARIGSRSRSTLGLWAIGALCGGAGVAAAALPLVGGALLAGIGVIAATTLGLTLLHRTAISSSR